MVADPLALQIAARYVSKGDRVLDPFCGTGRTLVAAAQMGAHAVGVDVNPLAVLISRAKLASIKSEALDQLLHVPSSQRGAVTLGNGDGRRVQWFPQRVLRELGEIVGAINALKVSRSELDLVAAVLSATVRESCYCRKDQWKLHRLAPQARRRFRPSAWRIFRRRLRAALDEVRQSAAIVGTSSAVLGDARFLAVALKDKKRRTRQRFDCVITSPPYGDSRTTVQYGGMSSLSLGVLRHIKKLQLPSTTTAELDGACLGGIVNERDNIDISRYWPGQRLTTQQRRVAAYLADLTRAFGEIAEAVKPGGHAIFILARRRVGAARVRIDDLAIDTFTSLGWTHVSTERRKIASKLTPAIVHRRARSSAPGGRVSTMREEIVLVFRRPRRTR